MRLDGEGNGLDMAWLSNQVDYIYFVHGLAMIFLACACAVLRRRAAHPLAWGWLGLFALFHGLWAWAGLIPLLTGPEGPWTALRALLTLLASMALVEFSRRSWQQLRRAVGGPWLTPILALPCLLAGLFRGWVALGLTAALVPGLLGGLWAALALVDAARNHIRSGRRLLLVAGCLLGLLILTRGALRSTLLPIEWLPSFPPSTTDLHVYLAVWEATLGLALAAILTLSLHAQHRQTEAAPYWAHSSYLVWSMPMLLAMLILGWFITDGAGRYILTEQRQMLLQRAQMAAAALLPDQVAALAAQPADTRLPAAQALRRQLIQMRLANADLRSVYLMAPRRGQIVFIADSEPTAASGASRQGHVYDEASLELRSSLRKGRTFIEGPLHDRRGEWISAYAPIRDPAAGHALLAMLGVDMSAERWRLTLASHRLIGITVALVLTLVVMGVFAGLQLVRESALQTLASENRFRAMFENAPEGVFVFDARSRGILDTNDYLCRWLGYTRDELLNMRVEELFMPGERGVEEQLRRMTSQGQTVIPACRYRRKDGGSAEVEVVGTAFRYRQLEAVLAFARDVSDRKRAEEQLRRSEDFYRSIIRVLDEGVMLIGADRRLLACNASAERILGLDAGSLLNQPLQDAHFRAVRENGAPLPPEEHPYAVTLRTGKSQSGVIAGVSGTPDREIWISINSQPLFRPDEPLPYAIVLSFADISGRKRYEAELARRDALLYGVAAATHLLLVGANSPEAIAHALGVLGHSAQVDRVNVFENCDDPASGACLMRRRFAWHAGHQDGAPEPGHPLHELAYARGFGRWHTELFASRSLHGPVRDFPPAERDLLATDGVQSLAVVPIMMDERCWGFIGVEDCHAPRVWSEIEISILQAMASSLAGVLQRREAEAELHRSQAELRKLALVASRTDNAVVISDAAGRIEWVNDGFTRITGFTLDEVRARRPGEFLYGPETDPQTVAQFRARLAAGESFSGEILNYTRNGRPHWMQIAVQPIRDAQGRLTNFIAMESDVTARRESEEKLRRSYTELERFNRVMTGREMRVLELKREVNRLLRELGRPETYGSVGGQPLDQENG